MLNALNSMIRAWLKELRNRRELNQLLQKDDRLLRDVGLTRADVEAALSKPISMDARDEAYRLSTLSLRLDRAAF